MLGGGVDAPTQRVPAEGSQRAGEDLGEDAFAAGHLHLSPARQGRGSVTARG